MLASLRSRWYFRWQPGYNAMRQNCSSGGRWAAQRAPLVGAPNCSLPRVPTLKSGRTSHLGSAARFYAPRRLACPM